MILSKKWGNNFWLLGIVLLLVIIPLLPDSTGWLNTPEEPVPETLYVGNFAYMYNDTLATVYLFLHPGGVYDFSQCWVSDSLTLVIIEDGDDPKVRAGMKYGAPPVPEGVQR